MFIAIILRVLMRVVNAVGEANQRRAEREIAEIIRRRGGKLADDVERGAERASSHFRAQTNSRRS
jgi:hypothetical protein